MVRCSIFPCSILSVEFCHSENEGRGRVERQSYHFRFARNKFSKVFSLRGVCLSIIVSFPRTSLPLRNELQDQNRRRKIRRDFAKKQSFFCGVFSHVRRFLVLR